MSRALNIWKFTDGKSGHESQSTGLVSELGKIFEVDEKTIDVNSLPNAFCMFFYWLFKSRPQNYPKNNPDLIIGAGHKTHSPMLFAKSISGGKTIVLMKPSLPIKRFDIVIAPKHDEITKRPNVIETSGVLNAIECVDDKNSKRGLMLIGGNSRHYDWNDTQIVSQIKKILEEDSDVDWTLTTSRRTPDSFLNLLEDFNIKVVPFANTNKEWMDEHYKNSGTIWVSPDSVSMVYESLTSGAATYVFSLHETSNESRVRNGLLDLVAQNAVMTFDKWEENPSKKHSPQQFNEASRVAKLILELIS